MAERLTKLRATAFRGIPQELEFDFPDGCSCIVLGPNGSGKSSIADAIEFYFTGAVSTLAREGRRILHHVSRAPEDAEVDLVSSGSLGGTVRLNTGITEARKTASRETFLLRGSTLAAFVDKTKHEKWQHLFDLLGIGDLERFREDLQFAANNLQGRATGAKAEFDRRHADLGRSIPALSRGELLKTLRASADRAALTVPDALEDLLREDWTGDAKRQESIKKAARLEQLQKDAASLDAFPAIALAKAWNTAITSSKTDDRVRRTMISAAETLFESKPAAACPLCGQEVQPEAFKLRLREMLDQIKVAQLAIDKPRETAARYLDRFDAAVSQRAQLALRSKDEGIPLAPLPVSPVADARHRLWQDLPIDVSGIANAVGALDAWTQAAREMLGNSLQVVDPKDAELVRFFSLLEGARHWLAALDKKEASEQIAKRASDVFNAYQNAQRQYIESILDAVSGRVAKIFERLHAQEHLSAVSVEPMGDKGIELSVTFHGTKHRPPHGVLSESRLNALGLSLFLGMADAFNEQLRFLCLDDVVNSFDADHRGSLASVLAEEFGDWQLIVLTHDPLFFDRVRRLAPSWRVVEFTSCSYDEGPRTAGYQTSGLIARAKEHSDRGEVTPAATMARRALEETLQEVCEGLASPLPFRRGMKNDHREAGELLNGVRRSLKELHLQTPEVKDLLANVAADLAATLNVEAHANSAGWASSPEVQAAIARVATFDAFWTCEKCHSRGWALGGGGVFRCKCGELSWPPPPAS